MQIFDVKVLMDCAFDDYEAAIDLSQSYRKKKEIICYLCLQAIEKYLKACLEYNDVIPPKSHDVKHLLSMCIAIDDSFQTLVKEVRIMHNYRDLRYQARGQVDEVDMNFCIKTVEKVKSLPIFDKIRAEIADTEAI